VILREWLPYIHRRVIRDHRRFTVQGHHRLGENAPCAVNYGCHRTKARAGLDYQSNRERIFAEPPSVDLLFDPVIENVEVLSFKIKDQLTIRVRRCHRNSHFVRGDTNLRLGLGNRSLILTFYRKWPGRDEE
jgi:hypothetical protein